MHNQSFNQFSNNQTIDSTSIILRGLNISHYIHKRIISGGPSWVQTTWDWLMDLIGKNGWTLVNVVGAIWSVGVNTISAVKNVANDVWDGIKEVGQFILDTIMKAILDSIIFVVVNLIKAIRILIETLYSSSGITFTDLSNGVRINGYDFTIYRNDFDLIIKYDEVSLNLGNILFDPQIEPETLFVNGDPYFGVNDDLVFLTHTLTMLGFLAIVPTLSTSKNYAAMFGAFIAEVIAQLFIWGGGAINGIINGDPDIKVRQKFKDQIVLNYILQIISIALVSKTVLKGTGNANPFTDPRVKLLGLIDFLFAMVSNIGDTSGSIEGDSNYAISTFTSVVKTISYAALALKSQSTKGTLKDLRYMTMLHIPVFMFFLITTMFVNP